MARLLGKQASEQEQRDELLSAYLDGQLSAEEQTSLEAQLAADPALRAELKALRCTVALVRELPQMPAPRNFILPQTAAVRPRPAPPSRSRLAWAAPFLTAATAVASLLFVLTLAGGLLLPRMAGMAPAAAPLPETEAPQLAMEPSPPAQKAATEEPAEVESAYADIPTPTSLAVEAPPETGEADHSDEEAPRELPSPVPAPPTEGAGAAPPPLPAATATETWEEPAAEIAPGEATEAPLAPAAVGGGAPAEEAKTSPTPAPTDTPTITQEPTTTPVEPQEVEPTPGEVAAYETDGERGAVEGSRLPREGRGTGLQMTPWLVLEIVLGLAAVGLTAATILAWRARRR